MEGGDVVLAMGLLMGCFQSAAPEETLPGSWSTWVNQEITGLIDVNTQIHTQLWLEDDEIVGWLYHTKGTWELQDQYITPPCDPEWVHGTYREDTWGYHISCMYVGDKCLSTRVHPESVEVDLGDLSYGMLGWIKLEDRIDPPENGKEEFECQK